MATELQPAVASARTSQKAVQIDRLATASFRPALLARYRDLTSLRYDFPLVLVRDAAGESAVQSLSGIFDDLLKTLAHGDDGRRVASHVLRLEREIRALAAQGDSAPLTELWDTAADRLGPHGEAAVHDSLARARAGLKVDGEVVDCQAGLPARLLTHLWAAAHRVKTRRFRADVGRLIVKLKDMVRADIARSDAGRTAEALRASVGSVHDELFDFEAMARVLSVVSPKAALTAGRRERLQSIIDALEGQRFYPLTVNGAGGTSNIATYEYSFDTCAGALAAYRQRLPALSDLTRAMAMAELEIAGAHRGAAGDVVGWDLDADGSRIDPRDLALFPDYLVCVDAGTMSAAEQSTLADLLSAGLPVRVLLQTDDVLEPGTSGDGRVGFGRRNRLLGSMAIALNDVFVLQSAASHVFQARGPIMRGLAFRGPSLFSVFSGAPSRTPGVPPYLVSALAIESRVFPAFVYDPSAGPDWASRFSVEGNPQPERDWPVQRLVFEDAHHQTLTEDVAVTAVDFMACDRRYALKFTAIANGSPAEATAILWAVDDHHTLQKVQVDASLVRETQRCVQMWRSLQELGGIHNSFVARALARQAAQAEAVRPEPVPEAAATPAASPATARPPGDPYIETPRCTTCNECTRINNTMFAYNDNKQAFIANPDAGTYAQLVEAAESCQVSIIHPGVPRNQSEPGLDELRARAEAFA
jgi:ferredoxin